MQPTNRSSRILLPVRLWFIHFSLLVALGLAYVPTGRFPGVPDWVALGMVKEKPGKGVPGKSAAGKPKKPTRH